MGMGPCLVNVNNGYMRIPATGSLLSAYGLDCRNWGGQEPKPQILDT